eukprot:6210315-Pleurochrysis_carterae.AAC.1
MRPASILRAGQGRVLNLRRYAAAASAGHDLEPLSDTARAWLRPPPSRDVHVPRALLARSGRPHRQLNPQPTARNLTCSVRRERRMTGRLDGWAEGHYLVLRTACGRSCARERVRACPMFYAAT